jgi:hypothetical protein
MLNYVMNVMKKTTGLILILKLVLKSGVMITVNSL